MNQRTPCASTGEFFNKIPSKADVGGPSSHVPWTNKGALAASFDHLIGPMVQRWPARRERAERRCALGELEGYAVGAALL